MGLFLAAIGVLGAGHEPVERSIASYAEQRGGRFELCPGETGDRDIAVITRGAPNTTILCPRDFMKWDELSEHLSKDLKLPVFSFHIHDGDFWMFTLFDQGIDVARFNPIPDYWEGLTPHNRARWAGDAKLIAEHLPGVSPARFEKYLVEWTSDLVEAQKKAYPDDEYPYGCDWQLVDFMRQIGIKYPVRNDGTPDGETFRLTVE